ncbi:hypothetical protein [Dyella subtropica]|uniref:hypothetical protein n=1 Tax=Dyella subtropica TaxID=2992127 RepID=UPI00225B891B|nr:hypothetical protein [Dyella subtropica]
MQIDRRSGDGAVTEILLDVVTYSPEAPYWNLFAMDDEDLDGFTWMRNVLSSPERMAVFTEANR